MSVAIRGEDATCLLEMLPEHATICIEGHTASGKTTAGKKIADTLGAKFFDTDNYIIKDSASNAIKPYEDMIDIQKLSIDLYEDKGKKILCGICLRKILNMIKPTEDLFFIYIKRISRSSLKWVEEDVIDDIKNGILDISKIPEPHASDYRYILEEHPQNSASIVFERLE